MRDGQQDRRDGRREAHAPSRCRGASAERGDRIGQARPRRRSRRRRSAGDNSAASRDPAARPGPRPRSSSRRPAVAGPRPRPKASRPGPGPRPARAASSRSPTRPGSRSFRTARAAARGSALPVIQRIAGDGAFGSGRVSVARALPAGRCPRTPPARAAGHDDRRRDRHDRGKPRPNARTSRSPRAIPPRGPAPRSRPAQAAPGRRRSRGQRKLLDQRRRAQADARREEPPPVVAIPARINSASDATAKKLMKCSRLEPLPNR